MLCECGHEDSRHRTPDGSCGAPECRAAVVPVPGCPVFRLAAYRTVWSQPAMILTACQRCGATVFPFMSMTHDRVCLGRAEAQS
jgi:hypothetical protein